jgi:hypothetical protein
MARGVGQDSIQDQDINKDKNQSKGGETNRDKDEEPGTQFEIFLRQDADISEIFRSPESGLKSVQSIGRNVLGPAASSMTSPQDKSLATASESKMTPSKFKAELPNSPDVGQLSDTRAQTARRRSPPSRERYELQDRDLDIDVDTARRRRRRSSPSPARTWEPEAKRQELLKILDGAHFPSSQEKEQYREFKQHNLAQLRQITLKQDVVAKNPSAWLPSLTGDGNIKVVGKTTWTHREVEWERAERRLLFAVETEEMCDKWVSVLNWVLHK